MCTGEPKLPTLQRAAIPRWEKRFSDGSLIPADFSRNARTSTIIIAEVPPSARTMIHPLLSGRAPCRSVKRVHSFRRSCYSIGPLETRSTENPTIPRQLPAIIRAPGVPVAAYPSIHNPPARRGVGAMNRVALRESRKSLDRVGYRAE